MAAADNLSPGQFSAAGEALHAAKKDRFDRAFAALKQAGVEHDADHPIAAEYRAASNAVNHSNRQRDFGIANHHPEKLKIARQVLASHQSKLATTENKDQVRRAIKATKQRIKELGG